MSNNTITLQELFKGKETIVKNKEFFATKIYAEPFIEKMSKFTKDFRIQAVIPDQITKTGGSEDITYNRVLIQAVMPEEYTIENHEEVIGFVYGVDVRKPVVKLFRGYLNSACTNLCVFNPSWLNIQELLPGARINFSPVDELMSKVNDFRNNIKKLKESYLDRNERKRFLGEWVDYSLRGSEDYGFGKVKITQTTPIDAYKSLFIDQESEYYIPEGCDPTLFDVYNAFTQIITDDKKDMMNKFEKTIIIKRLLGIQD